MTGPALTPAPGAAEPELPASLVPPDDSEQWRKVHWLTPLVSAWQVLTALVLIVLYNSADVIGDIASAIEMPPIAIVVLAVAGAVLAVLLIALLYSYVAWKRIRYAVSDDAVYYHSGIFFRSQRHARLNRIQGVDINRPLLGRMVGISAVSIESAGGAGSNVEVKFLKDDDAEALRAEILARAAGVSAQHVTASDGAHSGPAFAIAPERVVYQVTPGMLTSSLLRSGIFYGMLAIVVGIIASGVWAQSFSALAGLLPTLVIAGSVLWGRFAGEFGFTLAISPDGMRTRQGLLSTRAKTLPPGRIQAISLTQPFFWRGKDWWRVRINVAGYGAEGASSSGDVGSAINSGVLVPVGTRGDALNAVWLVLRDLGVDNPDEVIEASLRGSLADGGYLHSPRQARWVDPIKWKRNGLLITRTAVLFRTGQIVRSLVIVPHERTQSLKIVQGPLERKLHVAGFRADSVTGTVAPYVEHLPELTALQILREQAERARQARAVEPPEEWMRRVGVAAHAPAAPSVPVPGAPAPGETGTPAVGVYAPATPAEVELSGTYGADNVPLGSTSGGEGAAERSHADGESRAPDEPEDPQAPSDEGEQA
ncbi:putative membrane protein [Ruaniaceae bacterium KH17]|nr:putative membrane protein [Ruaniaceae bacterium KH17]